MDGEESFDGLLWYRENEENMAFMNADSVRRVVNVGTAGTAVKIIYGDGKNVRIENEQLSVMLEPGEMILLEQAETPWLGVYADAVLVENLQNGTFTVRGTGGEKVFVALYKEGANGIELTSFNVAEEGTTLSVTSDSIDKAALFKWEGLGPISEYVLKRLSVASK